MKLTNKTLKQIEEAAVEYSENRAIRRHPTNLPAFIAGGRKGVEIEGNNTLDQVLRIVEGYRECFETYKSHSELVQEIEALRK